MLKETRHRDPKYLDWLKTQPCAVTGRSGSDMDAIDPAHTGAGGKGLKADDMFALPMLHSLHADSHQRGAQTFWIEKLAEDKFLLQDLVKAYAYVNYYMRFKEETGE